MQTFPKKKKTITEIISNFGNDLQWSSIQNPRYIEYINTVIEKIITGEEFSDNSFNNIEECYDIFEKANESSTKDINELYTIIINKLIHYASEHETTSFTLDEIREITFLFQKIIFGLDGIYFKRLDETIKTTFLEASFRFDIKFETIYSKHEEYYEKYESFVLLEQLNKFLHYADCHTEAELVEKFYIIAAAKLYQIYYRGLDLQFSCDREKNSLAFSINKIHKFLLENSSDGFIYRLFIKLEKRSIFDDLNSAALFKPKKTEAISLNFQNLNGPIELQEFFQKNIMELHEYLPKWYFKRAIHNFQFLSLCMREFSQNTNLITSSDFNKYMESYLLAAEQYIDRVDFMGSVTLYKNLFVVIESILDQNQILKIQQSPMLGFQFLSVFYFALTSILKFDFSITKIQDLILRLAQKVIAFEKNILNSYVLVASDANVEKIGNKLLSFHVTCYHFGYGIGTQKFFQDQIYLIYRYLDLIYQPNRNINDEYIPDIIAAAKTWLINYNLYGNNTYPFHKSIINLIKDRAKIESRFNLDLIAYIYEHQEHPQSYYEGIAQKIQILFETTDKKYFSLDDLCFYLKIKNNSIEKLTSKQSIECTKELLQLYNEAYEIIDILNDKFGLSEFLPKSILSFMLDIFRALQNYYSDDAISIKKYRTNELSCWYYLLMANPQVISRYEYGVNCYQFYSTLLNEGDMDNMDLARHYQQQALDSFTKVSLAVHPEINQAVFQLLSAKIHLECNNQELALEIVYRVIDSIKDHLEFDIELISILRNFLHLFLDRKLSQPATKQTIQDIADITTLWDKISQIKWQQPMHFQLQLVKKRNNRKLSSLAILNLDRKKFDFLKASEIICEQDGMLESPEIFTWISHFKLCELKFKSINFLWEDNNFVEIFNIYQFAIKAFETFLQNKLNSLDSFNELFNLISVDLRKIILSKDVEHHNKSKEALAQDYWKICSNSNNESHYFLLHTEMIQKNLEIGEYQPAIATFNNTLQQFGKTISGKNGLSTELLMTVKTFFSKVIENTILNEKYLKNVNLTDYLQLINELLNQDEDKRNSVILYQQIYVIQQKINLSPYLEAKPVKKMQVASVQIKPKENSLQNQANGQVQSNKNNLASVKPVTQSLSTANNLVTNLKIKPVQNPPMTKQQKAGSGKKAKMPNNSTKAKNNRNQSISQDKSKTPKSTKSTDLNNAMTNLTSTTKIPIVVTKVDLISEPILIQDPLVNLPQKTMVKEATLEMINKLIKQEETTPEEPTREEPLENPTPEEPTREEPLENPTPEEPTREEPLENPTPEEPSRIEPTPEEPVREQLILDKTKSLETEKVMQPLKWELDELLQNENLHTNFFKQIFVTIPSPKLVFIRLYAFAGMHNLNHQQSKLYAYEEMLNVFLKAIMNLVDLKDDTNKQVHSLCMKFFNFPGYDDFNYKNANLFEDIIDGECKFKNVQDHIQRLKTLTFNFQPQMLNSISASQMVVDILTPTPNKCEVITGVEQPQPKYLVETENEYAAPIPEQLNVKNKIPDLNNSLSFIDNANSYLYFSDNKQAMPDNAYFSEDTKTPNSFTKPNSQSYNNYRGSYFSNSNDTRNQTKFYRPVQQNNTQQSPLNYRSPNQNSKPTLF